ncbi:MAG: hypothetical protein HFJ66_08715 [Eggerthellaceae bacterium]|nr:hypothetical protein [Eggerthellaceae bacterium]
MPKGFKAALEALAAQAREGGTAARVEETGFGSAIVNATDAEVGVLGDADTYHGNTGETPDTSIEPDTEALAAMSADERIERIRESVERHPRHRELCYLIMAYVKEHPGASYAEVEKYLGEQPQFASSLQSERILIAIMERAGAIESDGSDAGSLNLTDPGSQFEASFTPEARMKALIDGADADQVEAYEYILKACAEKKQTFADLEEAVKQMAAVRVKENGQMAIYPSTYIDRLEKAAGLRWEQGWVTTDAGKAYVK